jgi:hydroxypyruvate isomerase
MPLLRHSAPDWCFFKNQCAPAQYYGLLKAAGCSGAEMVRPDRFAAARAAGLEILNITGTGHERGSNGLNRRDNHPRLLAKLRDAIRLAADNGIGQVIVLSGERAGGDPAAGLDNVVAGLREVAPVAEDSRVLLVFEMLCRQDHPDYEADNSAYGFEVVRRVDSPAVKVLYDTYHMHRMRQDVIADVATHAADIAHIHVAGAPRRDCPADSSEIDYAGIVSAAIRGGFDGVWGHEFLPGKDAFADLERSIRLLEGCARLNRPRM